MRVILHAGPDCDSLILQARAAKAAIKKGHPKDGYWTFIGYEDGSEFVVKWNKASVTVWPQSLPSPR